MDFTMKGMSNLPVTLFSNVLQDARDFHSEFFEFTDF